MTIVLLSPAERLGRMPSHERLLPGRRMTTLPCACGLSFRAEVMNPAHYLRSHYRSCGHRTWWQGAREQWRLPLADEGEERAA